MNWRRRNTGGGVKLEMTPMIDVVFQLLIFFIVSLKQEDIISSLDVVRPTVPPVVEAPRIDLLQIDVGEAGYALRGRALAIAELDRQLSRLATFDRDLSVVIKCTGDSAHGNLVRLLDVCAKAGLKNLSVLSR